MTTPSKRALAIALLAMLATACNRDQPDPMLGTLEWDRVGVAAEVSEPIVGIAVKEGDFAHAGDAILTLACASSASVRASRRSTRHGRRWPARNRRR